MEHIINYCLFTDFYGRNFSEAAGIKITKKRTRNPQHDGPHLANLNPFDSWCCVVLGFTYLFFTESGISI